MTKRNSFTEKVCFVKSVYLLLIGKYFVTLFIPDYKCCNAKELFTKVGCMD